VKGTDMKGKRVAVLLGGMSSERDVSLRTGAAVAGALRGAGHDVVELDVGTDVARRLAEEKVEVAFIALHGRYGEDGCIQGLLESLAIPYTGSGVLASALAMDKVAAKRMLEAAGIPTPRWCAFDTAAEALAREGTLGLELPVVVKPSREGSSVGVHVCKGWEAYREAVREAATHAGQLLVEAFVAGREVQGAVLDGEALGVIEVVPGREFYDFQAKYGANSGTRYLFPAPLPEAQYHRVNAVCLAAHRALGCSGATRSDVILTPTGEVYLLEVNTLPGMTATSLLPKISEGRGISFTALCERLLAGASLKA